MELEATIFYLSLFAIFLIIILTAETSISKILDFANYLFNPNAKKENEFHSLCTKLVVYTAYYCGSDRLNEETLSELNNFHSWSISENENGKSKIIIEEVNEYFKTASQKGITKSDILLLCYKIAKLDIHNNTYYFRRALFSAAFQTGEFYQTLHDICEKLGISVWDFSDLYKIYSKEYKKRGSNTTQNKKGNKSTSNNTQKREYKKREYKKTKNNKQQEQKETSFVTLTLELLVEAMKVDRSKMVCELDVIKAFILKYDKENFQERVLEVKKYLNYEYIEVHVEEICTNIYKQFRQDYHKREEILKLLFELIYADETCTYVEYNFLKKTANMLKISKTSFDFMRMKFENRKNKKQENKQQSYRQDGNYQKNQNQNSSQPKYTSELEKAYAALGIDKDASDKEIRACWRNLIRVNHPDLMESKGAAAVLKATEKCQELNKAFEIVKASRGMK
ncbi:MAG: DnaJ domain-containing protein [Paludibacteraceae bacterium]|nr:DnaJ domain-containing protein [Paludibacteraceae bacterium]